MAKMVAAINTTSWGGKDGSLALVLNDANYKVFTRYALPFNNRLYKPALLNSSITSTYTPLEILTHQEEKNI